MTAGQPYTKWIPKGTEEWRAPLCLPPTMPAAQWRRLCLEGFLERDERVFPRPHPDLNAPLLFETAVEPEVERPFVLKCDADPQNASALRANSGLQTLEQPRRKTRTADGLVDKDQTDRPGVLNGVIADYVERGDDDVVLRETPDEKLVGVLFPPGRPEYVLCASVGPGAEPKTSRK